MSKNSKDVSFPPCNTNHESIIHIVQITPTGTCIVKDENGQYSIDSTKTEYIEGLECSVIEKSYVDCKLTPFPLEGYQKHTDAETGRILPLCCTFHKEVLDEASLWFDKFPHCCDLHRKMEKEYWFKKDNYNFMPDKIVTQVAMTEYVIFKKIDKPEWYEAITGYIDHNFLCFGSFAVGLNIYLNNLERSIKLNTLVPADKAQKLVKYINHVGQYYKFSTDWIENHPLIEQWLTTFPFDIPFMEHLKKEFSLFEVPLPFDTKSQTIKYESMPYSLKNETIEIFLYNMTKTLLGKITASTLYKQGVLAQDSTTVELKIRKFDLKFNPYIKPKFSTNPKHNYFTLLEEWFRDMIDLVKDLSAPIKEELTLCENSQRDSSNTLLLKTKQTIEMIFNRLGRNDEGWKYAFWDENDYNEYVDLLAKFFAREDYSIPTVKIQLKRNTKTKVAKALGTIHGEITHKNLKHDKPFFEIARVLNLLDEEFPTDDGLYNALSKEKLLF